MLKRYPPYGQPISKDIPEPATTFFYDRLPIGRVLTYQAGGVAPHAAIVRASYTVPTGKKAIVESVTDHISIDIVASGVSGKSGRVRYTVSGGSTINLVEATLRAAQNTIGDREDTVVGLNDLALEGDVIDIQTVDGSTGGVITYLIAVKMTEFSD